MDIIQLISNFMTGLLGGINQVTGNYGLALVVFALVIRTLLFRPTVTMYKSSRDMEKLKPKLEALKKEHGADAKRLNEEMMKLYSEANVNPLAGCLPALVQMPIFFGILRAISSNPDIFKSAYFLWMHPGTLQSRFPGFFASSLAEADIVLVGFYCFMMILAQRYTPGPSEPSQKAIGLYMSVFFSIMVWNMKWPCALVLYWTAFQFFSVMQSVWILKMLNRAARTVPEKL